MRSPPALLIAIDAALERARSGAPSAELGDALTAIRALAERSEQALSAANRELGKLTTRYATQLRLFEDLRLERICDAIEDIVVNVLGSEDFVVFLSDQDGAFYPVRGVGPSDRAAGGLAPDDPLGAFARSGRCRYDEPGWLLLAPMPDPAGRPVGLLAVRTLLSHKEALTADDREIVEELRANAGRALGLMVAQAGAVSGTGTGG